MQVIIREIACFVNNFLHLLITRNGFYAFFNNRSAYKPLDHFCVLFKIVAI